MQDRDLGSLADADAAQVRRLQRRYVEVWVAVLARLHPAADAADLPGPGARRLRADQLHAAQRRAAGPAGDGRAARRHGLGRRDRLTATIMEP